MEVSGKTSGAAAGKLPCPAETPVHVLLEGKKYRNRSEWRGEDEPGTTSSPSPISSATAIAVYCKVRASQAADREPKGGDAAESRQEI